MGVWDGLDNVESMARLLLHTAHTPVRNALHDLVREYRTASDRTALRPVQEQLAGALSEAERMFGAARRAQKLGAGDAANVAFWRAACVRLRAVGDAIAWKFLGFRRQWIFLLGRNQHPGHVTSKAGFADEWQKFHEHWDDGDPTLLTGLTSAITLGDLLVAREDVLWTIEVKRDPSHFRRAQTEKLRKLQTQLMGMPRIEGPKGASWIVESGVPYRSAWSEADTHIQRAVADGFAAWVPSTGVGVLFSSIGAASKGREAAEAILARERTRAEAELGPASHAIVVHSYSYPYRSRTAAPFPIFPIRAEYASMMLAGELIFTVELRIERLLTELRRVGLDAHHLLSEEGEGGKLPSDIIDWQRGKSRGVVHSGTVEQLAIELLDPGSWAEALADSLAPPGPERKWGSYVCLAHEDEVWL